MKYNQSGALKEKIKTEVADHVDATVNKENGLAFDASDKTRLALQVLTCLVNEPKFYDKRGRSQTNDVISLAEKLCETDYEYVLNLAKVSRHEFYLRSVPMVLVAVIANKVKDKPYLAKELATVISRADELTEVIAAYNGIYGKTKDGRRTSPIPSVLKRTVAFAFRKFDEYQFGKYNRDGDIKLKDAFRIVLKDIREKDKKRRSLYKKILEDTLAVPETWETVISTKGSTKENWESIIPKMGYMALLRNLRNFSEKGVDLEPVLKTIADPEKVAKSRQFPFRFYSAYKEVGTGKIKTALTTALKHSIANLPKLKGKTFMTSDNSGSMCSPLSERSKIQYIEVGALLQAMAFGFCEDSISSVFGEDFQVVEADQNDSIITNAEKFRNTNVGHSTNAYLVLNHLLANNIKVDRIMVFSDMQCYDSRNYWGESKSLAELFKLYKIKVNKDVKLYSFDLTGYGTLQFPEDDGSVVFISGWSEKIFRFINLYENGDKGLVNFIENYGGNDK